MFLDRLTMKLIWFHQFPEERQIFSIYIQEKVFFVDFLNSISKVSNIYYS